MTSLPTVTPLMLHQDSNSAPEWRRPRGSVWANVWLILKAVKEQSRSQPTPKCQVPYIISACIFCRGTPAIPFAPLWSLPTGQKGQDIREERMVLAGSPKNAQKVNMQSGNLDNYSEFSHHHSLTLMLIYWLCHSLSVSDLWSCVFTSEPGFVKLVWWVGNWTFEA